MKGSEITKFEVEKTLNLTFLSEKYVVVFLEIRETKYRMYAREKDRLIVVKFFWIKTTEMRSPHHALMVRTKFTTFK